MKNQRSSANASAKRGALSLLGLGVAGALLLGSSDLIRKGEYNSLVKSANAIFSQNHVPANRHSAELEASYWLERAVPYLKENSRSTEWSNIFHLEREMELYGLLPRGSYQE